MTRLLRFMVVPALVGALSLGSAWAGAGLVPAPVSPEQVAAAALAPAVSDPMTSAVEELAVAAPEAVAGTAEAAAVEAVAELVEASPTGLRVGAAKVNIAPRPDAAKGQVWKTAGCATIGNPQASASHVANFDMSPWPEDPGCIYMGGYGIGPSNPVKAFDETYGLWVRAVAVTDGSKTVVLSVLDAASYFGDYNRMCTDCGAFDLAQQLGGELDIDPSGFFFASTHSHTAPDFIGGWGGVPGWYMDQVADSIRRAVREAVAVAEPAVLEAGEELARVYNRERRRNYRSAEDASLTWFRALAVDGEGTPTGETIATVGAFAAHPTTVNAAAGIAHPDWPGLFAARLEERFGGIGMHFMTGLGNMSSAGGTQIGVLLADLLPTAGAGTPVAGTEVRTAQAFWDQPVTNSGLTGLGLPGFFDRPFAQTPASVRIGKNANKPCASASPISVRTAVSAAKIGNLSITGAPGEVFSNLTNTIKERQANQGISLPLAQVNDGLGYIIQSFETDHAGRQILGFTGDNRVEYEDAYSMDACFGDMVLETSLALLANLSK